VVKAKEREVNAQTLYHNLILFEYLVSIPNYFVGNDQAAAPVMVAAAVATVEWEADINCTQEVLDFAFFNLLRW
jgi:hypothetical protein